MISQLSQKVYDSKWFQEVYANGTQAQDRLGWAECHLFMSLHALNKIEPGTLENKKIVRFLDELHRDIKKGLITSHQSFALKQHRAELNVSSFQVNFAQKMERIKDMRIHPIAKKALGFYVFEMAQAYFH